LAVVLWTCQKFLFPSAQFFLGNRDELHYTLQSDTGGPSGIATVFALHSIVMPEVQSVPTKTAIRRIDHVQMPVDHRLSVQSSRIGTGSPHAMLATVLWGVLLAMGSWALCFMRGHPRLRLTLGLTVAGQLVLHLIYGHETFLYAMHFAPLLVIVAALSTLTRARWIAVTVGAVVLLLAAVNNAAQF